MAKTEINVLDIDRGLIVAPAGCGKTQLISDTIHRHNESKPILVLTHTNAGVAALRQRLENADVKSSKFHITTIDGWAIKLITTFPERAGHKPEVILGNRPQYPKIRDTALQLLRARHINHIVAASYSRLLVDEYQDCSIRQHLIISETANLIPTCVFGDYMQAIFGFGDDQLADWNNQVCLDFPIVAELDVPWRWLKADSRPLGEWLLSARKRLETKEAIDLQDAPLGTVTWVQLDGSQDDRKRQVKAASFTHPEEKGSVIIIGDSRNPQSQRQYASLTPGAVTVEAVDMRDLLSFAQDLNANDKNGLEQIYIFAKNTMTNVGFIDFTELNLVDNQELTDFKAAKVAFLKKPSYQTTTILLTEISKAPGVRIHRPEILKACLRALQMTNSITSFNDAVIKVREQNRFQGRPLPEKAVGSTLLLKGLESEVAVLLNADELDSRNLYVALTRASKHIVVCSKASILSPF